eukprot:SAG22_NODE_2520_length_2484_cov_1.545493_1_plen_205_part_10
MLASGCCQHNLEASGRRVAADGRLHRLGPGLAPVGAADLGPRPSVTTPTNMPVTMAAVHQAMAVRTAKIKNIKTGKVPGPWACPSCHWRHSQLDFEQLHCDSCGGERIPLINMASVEPSSDGRHPFRCWAGPVLGTLHLELFAPPVRNCKLNSALSLQHVHNRTILLTSDSVVVELGCSSGQGRPAADKEDRRRPEDERGLVGGD